MRSSPTLVGRDREVAELEEALSAAARGSGALVLVTGEAGIGKSRLAEEASTRARALGMRVLAGRAVEGGSHVPFRPVAEAVAAAVRRGGVPDSEMLRPYRHVLATLTPDWGEPAPAPASPVAIAEAVLRLLVVLAGSTGLVLVLEDLHWADDDTLALVDYLADHVRGERIVVLATIRSDEPGGGRALGGTLSTRRVALHQPLERLTRDDVAAMTDSAVAGPIYERSQGVPFLVEEFAASYADRVALMPPGSYRELIRARASRLDAAARSVVESAAALGTAIEWEYLQAATGRDADDVARAVKQAADAWLFESAPDDRIEFRHALVPETILAELATPHRVAAMARAAAAIEAVHPGFPGEWCERAADLFERAGETAQAVALLQESGRRALKRGAAATAERTLERARTLVAGDRWRTAGVDRVLVLALALQGKADRLSEIGENTLSFMREKRASFGSPDRVAEVHLRIAEGLAASARHADAWPHVEEAASLAEEADDAPVRARVLAVRAHLALDEGDIDAARAAAEELRVLAGLDEGSARVDGRIALAEGDIDRAAGAFRRALTIADRADRTVARVRALLDLAEIDELTTGSLDAIERARSLEARTESLVLHVEVGVRAAALHLARHELDDAEMTLRDVRGRCASFRLAPPAMLDLLDAELAALRGDKSGFADAAARAAAADPRLGPAVRAVGALAHVARDEREQAERAIEGVPLPARTAWLTEVLRATREPPAAFPFRHHYFHRVVGSDVDALRRALEFFEANGHARIAAACRGALTRAGVRVPRRSRYAAAIPDALDRLGITGREADVLRLIADGSTNREIAQGLFVSPRTVESHVASLMRKTGAKGRAALAALATEVNRD